MAAFKNEKRNNSVFHPLGDALNYASITMNLLFTTKAMLHWPSISSYDEWWLQHGFCVDHRDNRPFDTEVICFLELTVSAVLLYFFKRTHKAAMQKNDVLQAAVEGRIFANAAHGFGHLFLYGLGGPPPVVELTFSLQAIGWLLSLFAFWMGTFQAVLYSVSNKQSMLMAGTAIAFQTIIGVPPELSFTYSQSIILLAGAIDQLLLPAEKKGFTYATIAFSYLPTLVFFVLEGSMCKDHMVPFLGGHGLYDLYLSLLPFALFYSTQQYEPTLSCDTKKGL